MRKNDKLRRLADLTEALNIDPNNKTYQQAFLEVSGKIKF